MATHPENMPILYRNILDGLPSDLARDAFLWAAERPGEDRQCYRAERFAREVDQIVGVVFDLIANSARTHAEQGVFLDDTGQRDLLTFMLVRHANWRLGGNVKGLPFLTAAQVASVEFCEPALPHPRTAEAEVAAPLPRIRRAK